MPELWMPGATRMDIGDHAPTDDGPAKGIAHITWDKNATAAKPLPLVPYADLVTYFGTNPMGKAVASHILWSPFTGRCTQFVPANSRSKSLVDQAGGTRTNRAGSVVIQIEAHFFPYCEVDGKVYATLADTPCVGWAELHAWVRSWGVPDTWPMGRPTSFTPNRSEAVWERRAGWYGHSQVPENTHQDPGSWPEFTITPEPEMPLTQADADLVATTLTGPAYRDALAGANVYWLHRAADPSIPLPTGPGLPGVVSEVAALRAVLVAQRAADQAALQVVLAALKDGGGITAEQVTTAADIGATAALDRLSRALETPAPISASTAPSV